MTDGSALKKDGVRGIRHLTDGADIVAAIAKQCEQDLVEQFVKRSVQKVNAQAEKKAKKAARLIKQRTENKAKRKYKRIKNPQIFPTLRHDEPAPLLPRQRATVFEQIAASVPVNKMTALGIAHDKGEQPAPFKPTPAYSERLAADEQARTAVGVVKKVPVREKHRKVRHPDGRVILSRDQEWLFRLIREHGRHVRQVNGVWHTSDGEVISDIMRYGEKFPAKTVALLVHSLYTLGLLERLHKDENWQADIYHVIPGAK